MEIIKFSLLFLLMSLTTFQLHGQDLSAHRWQDRVLLVLADSLADPLLARQLEELQKEEAGLQERRLVVYQVLPGRYRTGPGSDGSWKESGRLHNRYRSEDTPFEVVLIGLDGGVKLRRKAVLPCGELFAVIDGMPMRRAEIRKNREGG